MTSNEIAIEIKELIKIYRGSKAPALSNINLSIHRGGIFGLLGPNGAGKTTMIRILCGLLQPSSGDVYINGYSVTKKIRHIRHFIGVVPQEIALYESLTAFENLYVFGSIYGLRGKELAGRINELLTLTGLEKSRNMKVKNFSGGMKRRLNLIAGTLHKPDILFLDEPTVGVDVQSKAAIIDNLKEINRAGTTIIYTSHYLEEAEYLCNYIAIIDEGKIISQGTLNEIKQANNTDASLEELFLILTGKEVRD
jgi:ABC-2 type transport system ATP-binding protein